MLRYNIENLAPEHLDTIIGVLDGDADGQQIAAVWIAKEHLRDLLALRATRTHVTPAPSAVLGELASFYIRARTDGITDKKTLAKTIGNGSSPRSTSFLTGYLNAKAEAHNRTAPKSSPGTPAAFANPENQARRVRMAHHPRRPARQAGDQPQPLTEGDQARGGQGAVAAAGAGSRTGREQVPDRRHPG